jgi:hypothetical protein
MHDVAAIAGREGPPGKNFNKHELRYSPDSTDEQAFLQK